MARFFVLLFVTFTLSACASILGDATQDVSFVTLGANDSVCYVDNGDVLYLVRPPDTINMSKRSGDLKIKCIADGNREKTIIIAPTHNSIARANVLNGFLPGMFVDSKTGALYEYPEMITVDFTDMQSRAMEFPNYHRHLIENPTLFGMEEFRPGRAALMRDKYDTVPTLQKREAPAYNEFNTGVIEGTEPAETMKKTSAAPMGKAVAAEAPDTPVPGLTKKMNPAVLGAPSGDSAGTTSRKAGKTAEKTSGKSVASTGPVTIYSVEGP